MFLREFFEKVNFEKSQQLTKNHETLPSMQRANLSVIKFEDMAPSRNYEKGSTVLIDFSLTVKAATLIFISGRSLAISSAKQGKSGSINNLLKN